MSQLSIVPSPENCELQSATEYVSDISVLEDAITFHEKWEKIYLKYKHSQSEKYLDFIICKLWLVSLIDEHYQEHLYTETQVLMSHPKILKSTIDTYFKINNVQEKSISSVSQVLG